MSALDGLVVEALVIIPVVAACRWFNRRRSAGAPGDLPPGPPDPYAVAWLRGGSSAVLQLAAYDLVRDSRLTVRLPAPNGSATPAGQAAGSVPPAPELVPLPGRAGAEALAAAARRLLTMVAAPCDRARLAGFARDLAPGFDAIDRSQRRDGLLATPAERLAGWAVTLSGMAVVLGTALWQLQGAGPGLQGGAVAVASLAAIGLAALRLLAAPEPRLSPRGRAYLGHLARALEAAAASRRGTRWIPAVADGQDQESPPAPAPGPLAVALSGMPALNGTAYAGLVALLAPASVAPGPPIAQDPAEDAVEPGNHPPEGSAQR